MQAEINSRIDWPGDESLNVKSDIARQHTQDATSNVERVLGAIRAEGTAARIDLARLTGISPATVTSVTAELMQAGLIEEVPVGLPTETRRGRPRVLLRIRGAAHRVIGAKLSDRKLTATILNFAGDKLAEGEYPMPTWPNQPQSVVEHLVRAFDDLCERFGIPMAEISGIGLGIPGFVDGPAGRVLWSRAFDQENVDLGRLLKARFSCPVFLDNDANLVAMAELWFGLGRKVRDFIAVTLESGLGMGIVIDGALYRGSRRRGAEFGHTKVALDGALCSCGQRGCLEAYVAEYALVREADLVLGDPVAREQSLDELYIAAKQGNARALEIFSRAGRMFGLGLANVVNIFDPSLIVLSGTSMRFDYLYDENVLASMRENMIKVTGDTPEVQIHKSGDLLWAQGAAALALDGLTEPSLAGLGQAD